MNRKKNTIGRAAKTLCLLTAALLLVGALCSCKITFRAGEKHPDGRLYIVCTVFPQYEFARNITRGLADVELLVPPGSDTHSFGMKDLSISKIAELAKADFLVCVGGESDEKFIDELHAVLPESVRTVTLTELADELLPEQRTAGMELEGDEEEGEEDEEGEEFDEHLWTSPKRAMELVRDLAKLFSEADPANAESYAQNADLYCEELSILDKKLCEITASAKQKTLIFADRFPFRYLCADYGLTADAAFNGCSTAVEPSLITLDYLCKKAAELHLPAILYMEGSTPAYAERLSEQIGGQALLLHSCHVISAEEFASETYLSLMERNLETLKIALGIA